MFKTPLSGLTFYDGKGTLSAYRTHIRDPLLFNKGAELEWRNCEETVGCGNTTYCPNQVGEQREKGEIKMQEKPSRPLCLRLQFCMPGEPAQERHPSPLKSVANENGVVYSTLVWAYTWPSISAALSDA
jgi:hypothetical protein